MKIKFYIFLAILLVGCDTVVYRFDNNYCNKQSKLVIMDSIDFRKYIYENDTINGWTEYVKFYHDFDSLRKIEIYKDFKLNVLKKRIDSIYCILDTISINNRKALLLLEKYKPYSDVLKDINLFMVIIDSCERIVKIFDVAKYLYINGREVGVNLQTYSTITKSNKLMICKKKLSWNDIGYNKYIIDSILIKIDLNTFNILTIDTIKRKIN